MPIVNGVYEPPSVKRTFDVVITPQEAAMCLADWDANQQGAFFACCADEFDKIGYGCGEAQILHICRVMMQESQQNAVRFLRALVGMLDFLDQEPAALTERR